MTYPIGYPLASSRASEPPRAHGPGRPIRATKDSPPSPRLSSRKLTAIGERLSDRDLAVMREVSRFRVLSGGHLQRLFWPEGSPQTRARLARHGLARLARLGILAPLDRTVGGVRAGSKGRCFALGLAGQRLVARGRPQRRPHTPGERYLAHTLAVAELYVALVEAERWDTLEVLAFEPEPTCWRDYPGPWGAALVLKPDAYVKLGVGAYAYSWLIEIDMATESLTTIERKVRRHLAYHQSGTELRRQGVAPRVAWIAPDGLRAAAIAHVTAELPPDARKLFVVTTTAEAIGQLATGVWS